MAPETSENNGALRPLLVNNLAVLATAFSALLAFQGSSYYEALLEPYAVTPGFVEISQADVLVHGFWAALWAVFQLIKNNVVRAVLWLVILLIAFIAIAALVHKYAWAKRLWNVVEPWSGTIERYNLVVFRWTLVILAIPTGIIAGWQGGNYDASQIERAIRHGAQVCFSTKSAQHRGLTLIQDQTKTVIVERSRQVRVINNDDLVTIGPCKVLSSRTALGQATRG